MRRAPETPGPRGDWALERIRTVAKDWNNWSKKRRRRRIRPSRIGSPDRPRLALSHKSQPQKPAGKVLPLIRKTIIDSYCEQESGHSNLTPVIGSRAERPMYGTGAPGFRVDIEVPFVSASRSPTLRTAMG